MDSTKARISMIVALGKKTRVIGRDNQLLWHLEGDLPRFKRITSGHPIIMGRKTWVSIGENPLLGRTNIVISSAHLTLPEGVINVHSLDDAMEEAGLSVGSEEIFIIGGGRVFTDALPYADRLYLTLVDDDAEGDAFFPEYETEFTKEAGREDHPEHTPPFEYVTLER